MEKPDGGERGVGKSSDASNIRVDEETDKQVLGVSNRVD